jgi:phosphoglucomutase/phosphomannomutase
MLMAELAAVSKARVQSLHERLEALFWQHGYHAERLVTQTMPGSEGMARMKRLMEKFRRDPPRTLGGLTVKGIRDYETLQWLPLGAPTEPLVGPHGDLVIFDLVAQGNYVAARPSGTEPKVKFYMFTFVAPEQLASLDQAQGEMRERLDRFQLDLERFAAAVE